MTSSASKESIKSRGNNPLMIISKLCIFLDTKEQYSVEKNHVFYHADEGFFIV